MNRTTVGVGVAVLLFSFALIAFPIAVTGAELFDVEQEVGLYLLPAGLVIILLGAIAHNPQATTVGGAFGNVEETPRRPGPGAGQVARTALGYNPKEPVLCRYCRTYIPHDIANCPRCARARECQNCGRPLGRVLERPTCPMCARPEPFCNCPKLARRPEKSSPDPRLTARL